MLRLRDDVPFIDDGFGEERPLREAEARALLKACATLSVEPVGLEELDLVNVEKWMAEVNRAREWAAGGAPPGRDLAGAADAWVAQVRQAREAAQVIRGMGAGDLVKAQRWITAHPNGPGSRGIPLLIEGHKDGSATIVGGAGGKLNGKKLGELKSQESRGPGPKTPAKPALKPPPRNPDGSADPWMGRDLPPTLSAHRAKAAAFIREYHALRRDAATAAQRGESHVDARRLQAAMQNLSPEFGDDNEDRWTRSGGALKAWAEGYVERASEHEPLSAEEAQAAGGAAKRETLRERVKAEEARSPEARDAKYREGERVREQRKQREEQLRADLLEREQKAAGREPAYVVVDRERKAAAEAQKQREAADAAAREASFAAMDERRANTTADNAVKKWSASAGKAGPGRARAMLEALDSGKPWPHTMNPNDAALVGPDRKPSLAGQRLLAKLRADGVEPVAPVAAPAATPTPRSGGSLGGSRQMPLFKSARFLLPIAWAAPLAKSTLAAPTTPGEVVDLDGVKARWRLAMSGAGVLEIPLATGKALLVLAANLSGALAAGREELARVLSGLAPRNALIGRPGALTSARK